VGDVAVVGHVRPVVGEHLPGGGVVLHEPGWGGAEGVVDGVVEHPGPSEEASDAWCGHAALPRFAAQIGRGGVGAPILVRG